MEMTKEEISELKSMLKITPNDFTVGIEDLYEIYSQEQKKNGL
jgi:hypothetical protein